MSHGWIPCWLHTTQFLRNCCSHFCCLYLFIFYETSAVSPVTRHGSSYLVLTAGHTGHPTSSAHLMTSDGMPSSPGALIVGKWLMVLLSVSIMRGSHFHPSLQLFAFLVDSSLVADFNRATSHYMELMALLIIHSMIIAEISLKLTASKLPKAVIICTVPSGFLDFAFGCSVFFASMRGFLAT